MRNSFVIEKGGKRYEVYIRVISTECVRLYLCTLPPKCLRWLDWFWGVEMRSGEFAILKNETPESIILFAHQIADNWLTTYFNEQTEERKAKNLQKNIDKLLTM